MYQTHMQHSTKTKHVQRTSAHNPQPVVTAFTFRATAIVLICKNGGWLCLLVMAMNSNHSCV